MNFPDGDDELPELPGEDLITFDEKYFLETDLSIGIDDEEIQAALESLPPLEKVMLVSFGTNSYVENFPYPVIQNFLKNDYGMAPENISEILSTIKPRERSDMPH